MCVPCSPESKSIFRPMKTGEFAKLMKTILKDHMIAAYFASEVFLWGSQSSQL